MDWIALIAPIIVFIVIVVVAEYSRKMATDVEGFFVASRNTNLFFMTGTYVASLASVAAMVAMASTCYRMGIGFNLWTWGLSGIILCAYTICLPLRRISDNTAPLEEIGAVTKPLLTVTDIYKVRFNHRGIQVIIAFVTIVGILLYALGQLVALALAFQMLGFSYFFGLTFSIAVLIWTCLRGGTPGTIINDTINMFTFIFASFILLYFVLKQTGGLDNLILMTNEIKPGHFAGSALVPLKTVITYFVTYNFLSWGSPHTIQRCYAAKNERVFISCMILAAVIIVMWIWGMYTAQSYGVVLFPTGMEGFSADTVLYELSFAIMPSFWSGVMIAGIIAVGFSTINTQMVNVAFSAGNDVYRVLFKPNATDEQIYKTTKILLAIFCVILWLMGIKRIAFLYEMMGWGIGYYGCILIPSLLFCFFWRRFNARAMFWGALIVAILYIFSASGAFAGITTLAPVLYCFPIAIILFVLLSFIFKQTEREKEVTAVMFDKVYKSYQAPPVTGKDYIVPVIVIIVAVAVFFFLKYQFGIVG